MKRILLITLAVGILLLLGFRFFYTGFSSGKEERFWYAQKLDYAFSARIDTVIMLKGNVGPGKLVCSLKTGTVDVSIEDSLNRHLKVHRSLRLLEPAKDNRFALTVPGADRFQNGDSVVVSSASNVISFFRKGNQVWTDQLSATLEARGHLITF